MATVSATAKSENDSLSLLRQYIPALRWLPHYRRENLSGDLIAGVIVAVMLVPQAMAYALLAGLPPQAGLYASIAPPIIYGLLGTSRALAIGPMATVSLLVASRVGALNPASPAEYAVLALAMALLSGLIQIGMGLLRIGFLVNFLSHPVLVGFTSAAAIVIASSQIKHILGLPIPRTSLFYDPLLYTARHLGAIHWPTVAVAAGAIALLLYVKYALSGHLRGLGLAKGLASQMTKIGPLAVTVIGTVIAAVMGLESAGVIVVGTVPGGLPPLTVPAFDWSRLPDLLPGALTISLVGYMGSISVAKSLASKRRESIDASQELIALGTANVGAALTGGLPVTGGISRSVVNFNAGARTGLASIITAGLVALTVLFLTPLFYHLPNAILASIIIVAVLSLVDFKTFVKVWRYNRADGLAMAATFFAVLFIGLEQGILVGALVSIALYLWRTSRPHIAVVGRIDASEHFRNVLRHDVETYPDLLLVRVDESLYFPNAQYLEERILTEVADCAQIDHLVLICSAVNEIDASALETLKSLVDKLHDSHVTLHLAEVKGPVYDRLADADFVEWLGSNGGQIFLSTHQAVTTLHQPAPPTE